MKIKYGECHCGCGEKTTINRGNPRKFLMQHQRRLSPLEYKVNKITGCWEWQRGLTSTGYGALRSFGKMEKAHRVYFKKYNGDIPEKTMVLHKCDNTLCVNPEHLFLGNQSDNMRDCAEKGRGIRGEGNHMAKLNKKKIMEIREKFKQGMTYKKLSEQYKITRGNIGYIILEKTWKF